MIDKLVSFSASCSNSRLPRDLSNQFASVNFISATQGVALSAQPSQKMEP